VAWFIVGFAVFIADLVDFSEDACGGIVRSAVCRHCQELPPKLGRSDRKHVERAAPVFGWNVLRDSSLNSAVRRMRTSLRYPYPLVRLGSEKAAPLGESGGAGLLVGVAVLGVALRWKVVVDRGMDRGELL
jgi:hypothetical protein